VISRIRSGCTTPRNSVSFIELIGNLLNKVSERILGTAILIVAHLAKTFPAFYVTRIIIAVEPYASPV
jgi:hypothetical protein